MLARGGSGAPCTRATSLPRDKQKFKIIIIINFVENYYYYSFCEYKNKIIIDFTSAGRQWGALYQGYLVFYVTDFVAKVARINR